MTKKKLQAIFFDFDGVIVDSTHTKTEAFRTLFKGYGDEVVSRIVLYHREHGGISRVDKLDYAHRTFLGKPLNAKDLHHWASKYSEQVVERVIQVDWVPGAEEFLDGMLNVLPIFVISGTPEDELKYVIKRRKMAHYFSDILGSPIRKPTHIRDLLNKYQLDPDQCVFVGDALTDYNAAKETGLNFVGIRSEVDFPTGTTVLEDCRELQAAISVNLTW